MRKPAAFAIVVGIGLGSIGAAPAPVGPQASVVPATITGAKYELPNVLLVHIDNPANVTDPITIAGSAGPSQTFTPPAKGGHDVSFTVDASAICQPPSFNFSLSGLHVDSRQRSVGFVYSSAPTFSITNRVTAVGAAMVPDDARARGKISITGGHATTGYECGKKLGASLQLTNEAAVEIQSVRLEVKDANGAVIGVGPLFNVPKKTKVEVTIETSGPVSGRIGETTVVLTDPQNKNAGNVNTAFIYEAIVQRTSGVIAAKLLN